MKVVLITGASSGIGRAAAERLTARGHKVFGTTRSAVQAVDKSGVEMLSLDLRDEAAATACAEEVLLRAGRIDVLVNNAGYALFGAVEETSPDEARELLDIHVLGALRMIRAVLPAMRQQHAGLYPQHELGAGIPARTLHGFLCRRQTRARRIVRVTRS